MFSEGENNVRRTTEIAVFDSVDVSSRRYMLGLSSIPAVVQFIGFFFLPESPRWLLQKGRSQEAHQVLSRIRGGQSVEREFSTIRSSVEEEEEAADRGEGNDAGKLRRVLLRFRDAHVLLARCIFRQCRLPEDRPPRTHPPRPDRRLRPPDVSAAVWDKHCHVCRPVDIWDVNHSSITSEMKIRVHSFIRIQDSFNSFFFFI